MSKKGINRDGRTIHQDYQGYYTLNDVGERTNTDMYGEPAEEFDSHEFLEDIKVSSSTLDYKGGNIFVKILMIILRIFTGFIKAIAKIASNLTFGR